MPDTKTGHVRRVKTIRERHGDDFYKRIGAKGGKVSRGGGFAYQQMLSDGTIVEVGRAVAARAGKKGKGGGHQRKQWTAEQRREWGRLMVQKRLEARERRPQ